MCAQRSSGEKRIPVAGRRPVYRAKPGQASVPGVRRTRSAGVTPRAEKLRRVFMAFGMLQPTISDTPDKTTIRSVRVSLRFEHGFDRSHERRHVEGLAQRGIDPDQLGNRKIFVAHAGSVARDGDDFGIRKFTPEARDRLEAVALRPLAATRTA
jgi:hypothetical protein